MHTRLMLVLLALLTWALDALSYRPFWAIGDLLAHLCPESVADRHQKRAQHAALWLEAYEERLIERADAPRDGALHIEPAERLTAARARLLLTLPWV